MTCSAVPERAWPAQARPPARRPALRGHREDRGHRAEPERRQVTPELHDGVIQARGLTRVATRRCPSLQGPDDPAGPDSEDLPDVLRHLLALPLIHDLDLSVEVTGTPVALPAPVRRSLQCAASECVFNAARGRARRAVVRLRYRPGVVVLTVADDGPGDLRTPGEVLQGGPGGRGPGLAGLACRAEEMGATMRVRRSDLGGIVIEVLVPVPRRHL